MTLGNETGGKMSTLDLTETKESLWKQIHSGVEMDKAVVVSLLAFLENKQHEMTEILIYLSEKLWDFIDDDANSETEADNFVFVLRTALQLGLDPNYLYTKDDDYFQNIMWEVVGSLKWGSGAPKAIAILLEYGGDPNLLVGDEVGDETVFQLVDDFIWFDGEATPVNVLLCWLQLAAYGGDENNVEFLPLRMLGQVSRDDLKNYENYTLSFETVPGNIYKRETVMFVIDRRTGEKVAVNETPSG